MSSLTVSEGRAPVCRNREVPCRKGSLLYSCGFPVGDLRHVCVFVCVCSWVDLYGLSCHCVCFSECVQPWPKPRDAAGVCQVFVVCCVVYVPFLTRLEIGRASCRE